MYDFEKGGLDVPADAPGEQPKNVLPTRDSTGTNFRISNDTIPSSLDTSPTFWITFFHWK
jgi:glutamate mutase epsilon subunit